MNIIRLNWSGLNKTILLLASLLAIKLALNYIFGPKVSSLKYDTENREFILNQYHQLSPNRFNNKLLFNRNGNKFRLSSAQFPFHKVRLSKWIESIQHIVKLGLNTIEIDIVWNVHETLEGQYDFSHGSNDLEEFIELVDHFGLFLLVRIDPYVPCSDSDFGGLPSWLLAYDNETEPILSLKNNVFKNGFESYLNKLLPILAKFQFGNNNGPIVGVLVQYYQYYNELKPNSIYSFYTDSYIRFLEDLFYTHGIFELLLKSVSVCQLDRTIDLANFKNYCDQNLFVYLPLTERNYPPVDFPICNDDNSKYWYAKPTNNNQKIKRLLNKQDFDLSKFKINLNILIKSKGSFSIANFFCLTNADFSSGAHHNLDNNNAHFFLTTHPIDVNNLKCLINGDTAHVTRKFNLTYNLILNNPQNDEIITSTNDRLLLLKLSDLNKSETRQIRLTHVLPYPNLLANLHTSVPFSNENTAMSMEQLTLNYKLETPNQGYILYRLVEANLDAGSTIRLNTKLIRDYAILICDSSKHLVTIDHSLELAKTISIKLNTACAQLDVFIENMGRLSDLRNVDELRTQRKGLLSKEAIGLIRKGADSIDTDAVNWEIHFLDFRPAFIGRYSFNSAYMDYSKYAQETCHVKSSSNLANLPIMAYTSFVVVNKTSEPGVYMLLSNFRKGLVLVNGHSLGRFWHVGPLLTLFLPNEFVNNGINEIVLFDLHGPLCEPVIYFTNENVLK